MRRCRFALSIPVEVVAVWLALRCDVELWSSLTLDHAIASYATAMVAITLSG